MSLREKINQEFSIALKNKNKAMVSTLRLILAAIMEKDIANRSGGKKEEVNPIEPIDKKFESFGFETISTNGNNISELLNVFKEIPIQKNKPTVIIAKTSKGSGVSFI